MPAPAFARKGYAFFSVITPQVAREYELLAEGELTGEERDRYEELQALAEAHGTHVHASPYQLL